MDDEDTRRLIALEESLWRPETRFDTEHLGQILAPDFDEFGRSGRHWSRAETLAMPAERFETGLPLPELRIRELGPDAVIITYRSETRFDDGPLLSAHRSSVWQRHDGRWRLRFHQGTPVAAGTTATLG